MKMYFLANNIGKILLLFYIFLIYILYLNFHNFWFSIIFLFLLWRFLTPIILDWLFKDENFENISKEDYIKKVLKLNKEKNQKIKKEIESEIKKSKEKKVGYTKGEEYLAILLSKKLDSKEYKIYNNIILPNEYKNLVSSEIDHLVVSKYGVFVLENKYIKGWIFGNEINKKWVSIFYKVKNFFINPVKQNFSHIKALESFLDIKDMDLISIIAFHNNAEFKDIKVRESVLHYEEIPNKILSYKEIIINSEKLRDIIIELNEIYSYSENLRSSHIKNIKNYLE